MILKYKIVLAIFLLGFMISCNEKNKSHNNHQNHEVPKEVKVYTCPMHPEIIRNEPGLCPICGMDLVEKITNGEKQSNADLDFLLKPTNNYVIGQINTSTLEDKNLTTFFDLQGYTTYDTRQTNVVSAKVSGRIEKLYVKSRYQPIRIGDKLMDIYSKELETEQQNLLFLLKTDPENHSLIKATEQKLLLLGVTSDQIETIKNSGKAFYSVTIFSPYSGHLHDIMQVENNEMPGKNMESASSEQLQIREGMYVTRGQTIFNIYDTRRIWAILNIPPDLHNSIKEGQSVILTIDGYSNKLNSSVDFIEPVVNRELRYTTARIYLNNSTNEIKIGAIVKATIEGKYKGKFIPTTAIVNLGLKNIVFVKDNNSFKTRTVKTGVKVDDWTEITEGVSDEDLIAQNGQFLIDSESFIKTTE